MLESEDIQQLGDIVCLMLKKNLDYLDEKKNKKLAPSPAIYYEIMSNNVYIYLFYCFFLIV